MYKWRVRTQQIVQSKTKKTRSMNQTMSEVCMYYEAPPRPRPCFLLSPAGNGGCAAGGGGRKLSIRTHSSSTSCSNNGRWGLLGEEGLQEIHATLTEVFSSMRPEAAGEKLKWVAVWSSVCRARSGHVFAVFGMMRWPWEELRAFIEIPITNSSESARIRLLAYLCLYLVALYA